MKAEKRILGKNAVFSTDSRFTGLNNNVIVCGSSGSGKTTSICEPLLLETTQSSLIVTVTKRRLVKKYSEMFKSRGYMVEDLDFIHPAQSRISFDPLQYVHSYMDITFLAEAIVNANPRKK